MLCENCGNNEATVRYTQIINGVKKQMNLCHECAESLGIDNISFNMPIQFSNFLGDMFDDGMNDFLPSLIKQDTLLCDKCKMSYEDFIETGKFGCDECYNTFSNKVDALLKNIHGVNRHVGRNGRLVLNRQKDRPTEEITKEQVNISDNSIEGKLLKLKEKLKNEVKEERYEDAAKTRDEIKKLSKE